MFKAISFRKRAQIMSRKFSYQGVIFVILAVILVLYYNTLFRDARRKNLQQQLQQENVLLNNQK